MSKVNRNNPKRSSASESLYTLFEFDRDFPNDGACLDYLMAQFYPNGVFCPKCQKVTKHYRDVGRPSYSCEYCGHHEHPMRGTIFENSATSLRLWFYAMYLMTSTRCGISAKQLERELGVTYKTAWRMFKQIRSIMTVDDGMTLDDTVEADETYMGGEAKNMHADKRAERIQGRGTSGKTPVFGMAKRGMAGTIHGQRKTKSGQIVAKVVPDASAATLLPQVGKRVPVGSTIYTDEWRAYDRLGEKGYKHDRVNHSQKVYVSGDAHTQTIDGFWSLLKRGIGGVYHSVSDKYLQSYLDEYTFTIQPPRRGRGGDIYRSDFSDCEDCSG